LQPLLIPPVVKDGLHEQVTSEPRLEGGVGRVKSRREIFLTRRRSSMSFRVWREVGCGWSEGAMRQQVGLAELHSQQTLGPTPLWSPVSRGHGCLGFHCSPRGLIREEL
jgi:hypothetical protein